LGDDVKYRMNNKQMHFNFRMYATVIMWVAIQGSLLRNAMSVWPHGHHIISPTFWIKTYHITVVYNCGIKLLYTTVVYNCCI